MGSARLQGKKQAPEQKEPATSQGLGNSNGTVIAHMWSISKRKKEQQERERASAAVLSAAEQAAAQKTAELANSAGANINTNSQGSSSYTEGNPGQAASQSQGDVDLGSSDTTLRRRGGYRRDAGISI